MARTNNKPSNSHNQKGNNNKSSNNRKKKNTGNSNRRPAQNEKPDENTPSKAGEERSDNINDKQDQPGNDPVWYSRFMELITDAGSLPYSEPFGDPLALTEKDKTIVPSSAPGTKKVITNTFDKDVALPGICTVMTKASFGRNRNMRDPANVAAQLLYTNTRYKNSGGRNYDTPDLFIYCASTADIYSFVMWAQRTYAKAFLYSQRNKYIGKALLQSENIDADDIVANLANFRYWLNAYINKISSFCVPADIMYYQRRAWIYSHVYLENPDGNIKDQLYQFSPDGFYRFNLDSESKGMLEYAIIDDIITRGPTDLLKYNDFVTIGNWLIANVMGDQDFGIISGDILKAFEGRIIGLAPLPEAPELIPVYDEYVLLQIKNSCVVPVLRSDTYAVEWATGKKSGNVYQSDNGNIVSHELVQIGPTSGPSDNFFPNSVLSGCHRLLTLSNPSPTPVDNMEITRLTPVTAEVRSIGEGTNVKFYADLSCGADIVVSLTFTRYSRTALQNYTRTGNCLAQRDLTYERTLLRTGFKYAPLLYVYNTTDGQDEVTVDEVKIFGPVDNYTIQPANVLAKLHEVSFISLLSIPGVAKVVM